MKARGQREGKMEKRTANTKNAGWPLSAKICRDEKKDVTMHGTLGQLLLNEKIIKEASKSISKVGGTTQNSGDKAEISAIKGTTAVHKGTNKLLMIRAEMKDCAKLPSCVSA